MMKEESVMLLNTVSNTVLDTIKTISDKKQDNKLICIDSVALILRVNLRDIMPIIEHLQIRGDLIIHLNPAKSRSNKPASVSLVNAITTDELQRTA